MKTRKQKKETAKNPKFWKWFYEVTLLIGLVLMVFQINIYRKTIIDVYIPISIILVVGLLTFYFTGHHYKKTFLLTGNVIPLLQNLVSWGFISCFIFMATNYYSAKSQFSEYLFLIKDKSSMSGRKYHRNERKPLVIIDYFNFEKELVFRYADTDEVNKSDSVRMIIRKGGLGFDILEDYDVVKRK